MYLIDRLTQNLKRSVDLAYTDAGAAVAVILKIEDEDLLLFLVKRAVNPSDPWSGNMALPGGRRHRGENIAETVVRETREETGIDVSKYHFLGNLDVQTSGRAGSPLRILPFVFLCDEKPEVTLNSELTLWFWVTLDDLNRGRGKASMGGSEVAAYLVNGEAVWGLTFRILGTLLNLLEENASGATSKTSDF